MNLWKSHQAANFVVIVKLFLTCIIWLDPQCAKRKFDKYCLLDLMMVQVNVQSLSFSRNSNSWLLPLIINNFELFWLFFEAKLNQKLSLNGMINEYRFIYMITRGYTYVRVRSRFEFLVHWRKIFDTDRKKIVLNFSLLLNQPKLGTFFR
jgi:hypothetical protein